MLKHCLILTFRSTLSVDLTAILSWSPLPAGRATLDKGDCMEGGRNTPSFSLLFHHPDSQCVEPGCNGGKQNERVLMNGR